MLLADADALARRSVRRALDAERDLRVVGSATTADEVIALAAQHRPDVLVTELALGDTDVATLLGRIAEECTHRMRVVVLSSALDDEAALRVVRAGADGALSKDVPLGSIARALRGVAAGQAALPRRLTMQLVDQFRTTPTTYAGLRPLSGPLTTREWEIVDLIAAGASTQEIARSLILAEATVYTHVRNILRRLGVRSRAQAVEAVERLRREAAERRFQPRE